ncbi:MAG: LysM peptidoglycan-binding domain-containing protein [Verrucomicrobiota bacterium]|nr:LysM peptidoglycan-binding domain-containing protein [Verrucomicrobiota bacterium]
MKGSNPIIPPGADFDGARQGRSNMRMAVVVVVAMHLVLFAGILFNACKQKEDGAANKEKVSNEMAQIVPPKTAPLPEPAPVLGLPSLPGATVESLPPLPPVGSSALPPIPDSVASEFAPAPKSDVAAVPAVPGTEHVIASGDNFWTIGRKYGVSHKKIEQANPNVIPTRLKIGQKIIIPATQPEPVNAPAVVSAEDSGSMYTVKSGDTLGHIALRHKVAVADIKTINSMNSDFIRIGQQIKLPVSEILAPVLPSSPTLPPIPTTLPTTGSGPSLDPGTGLPVGGTEGAVKPSEN